jgi:hypothetical protein
MAFQRPIAIVLLATAAFVGIPTTTFVHGLEALHPAERKLQADCQEADCQEASAAADADAAACQAAFAYDLFDALGGQAALDADAACQAAAASRQAALDAARSAYDDARSACQAAAASDYVVDTAKRHVQPVGDAMRKAIQQVSMHKGRLVDSGSMQIAMQKVGGAMQKPMQQAPPFNSEDDQASPNGYDGEQEKF